MSLFLCTDVTAVKIHNNLIFAGIGSYANIFHKITGEPLKRVQCLNGQKIYGFVPSKNAHEILVFGGKQFTILLIKEEGSEDELLCCKKVFEPVTCDDWLHSAVWVGDKFSLLTAHNVLQNWTATPSLISQKSSIDNSILYSGLLVPLQHDTLVLAGTVYSEVIVHHEGEVLHRLIGHKGAIFSISCDTTQGIIITTSDDRSVRIWGPNKALNCTPDTLNFWCKTTLSCKHELYGHNARVMRNCIVNSLVVSVGEDSAICFWNYDGKLLKKVMSHQSGGIWSIDGDDIEVVTGGSDGAVIAHPLTVITDHQSEIFKVDKPKRVFLTAKNNIVVLSENNLLIHCNVERQIETRHKLNDKSTFKVISLSSCKQMVAISDMSGKLDVFIENCKNTALMTKLIDTRLDIGNILSMHWADNRHLVFCSYDGLISVLAANNGTAEVIDQFCLPPCKERWLTSAAHYNKMFVFGDRCGNMHIYFRGNKHPVKTFDKIHGRYGPTSITIKNKEIKTTGRDGTVKLFSIKGDEVKFVFTKDLEFQWVDKFLDKDDTIACGFQERDFVVYNLKSNAKMCEVPCGGGHRSWDAMRYVEKINNAFEEVIKFVYIKNNHAIINKFVLSKIVSRIILNGSHSKAINCLRSFKIDDMCAFVTGSEDTTLRVSLYNTNILEGNIIYKHLSNIKTIRIYNLEANRILTISGGGRAQICATIIGLHENIEEMVLKSEILTDYMIKGIDKMRKNNQDWRNSTIDFDPETRIMDLDIVKTDDTFKIYAGCSDAFLRVFELNYLVKPKIKLINEIKFHKTCILKIRHIVYLNNDIILTCTTRGEVAFWKTELTKNSTPFFEIKTNKSGINSIATRIYDEKLILATGGDDNAIHLTLLETTDHNNLSSIKVLNKLVLDRVHSSQVSGLLLVNNYLISTSIDQRVTLLKWGFHEILRCKFISQICSDIADIQGMSLVEYTSMSITVCVYGNGMELIKLKLPDK